MRLGDLGASATASRTEEALAALAAGAEGGFDLLLFRIHDALFGVSLEQIREILEVDDYAKVTAPDPTLRGATYRNGSWLPMVDVARRLGVASVSRFSAPVLLVTDVAGQTIGFLVDDPEDVVTVAPEVFRPLPEVILRTRSRQAVYASGLLSGGKLLLLLDLGALMTDVEAAEAARICRELGMEAGS